MKAVEEQAESEQGFCQQHTQPYRKMINATPGLTSLLYDIDLLPEQIVRAVNVSRMIAVCELWKLAYPASTPINER